MKKDYITFKNNIKYESIDELLEDRKIYIDLLKESNNELYIKYIEIIENEIKNRLDKYERFYL